MLGGALLTGLAAVLVSATSVDAKEAPPHHALPSYLYGAPIRVECMNRNLYTPPVPLLFVLYSAHTAAVWLTCML